MTVWKFPRGYETELRLLNASSSVIQGDCQDPVTNSSIFAPTPLYWIFQTMVLEKTLESPVDCKEIKPANPKGNQPWRFTGRTDAHAEPPILWPPDMKSRLVGKDPDAGKDWGQEKPAAEDEMVGWHHWINGHESEQTPGDNEGQGGPAWCSPWGRQGSNAT